MSGQQRSGDDASSEKSEPYQEPPCKGRSCMSVKLEEIMHPEDGNPGNPPRQNTDPSPPSQPVDADLERRPTMSARAGRWRHKAGRRPAMIQTRKAIRLERLPFPRRGLLTHVNRNNLF
jgi:hypothetical protein